MTNGHRAQQGSSFSPQSQNTNTGQNKRVPLTLWVKPIARAETYRRAGEAQLSASAFGAALYEQAIQNHINMQLSADLVPIIEQAIRKELRRAIDLIVPVSLDVQIGKQLNSFTLEHLLRDSETLSELLRIAAARAKAEISYRLKNHPGEREGDTAAKMTLEQDVTKEQFSG